MNASGAPNTCKSNGFLCFGIKNSGERASNTYLICLEVRYNYRDIANPLCDYQNENMIVKDLSPWEEDAAYQVVGGVMAHQAYDG